MHYLHEDEYFGSSDLPLIATLNTLGGVIEAVDKNSGSRATFYIKRERGLDALVQAFYARELKVEPLAYYNALRDCKSRLYAPVIE